jgi:hypothetical protein
MDLIGPPVESLRRFFHRPVLSSQDVYSGIDVLVRGACVGCLSSLRHALDRLHLAGKLQDNPQTILLGMRDQSITPELKDDPGEVWCYGNCGLDLFIKQFESLPNTHWLKGCPPHFMEFYQAYCQALGLDPPKTE